MKVFSINGLHRGGKTTAVEGLIKFLRAQRQSVSSIKDIHAENWTMEREGSNSFRHLQASNTCVIARGHRETHQIWNRQLSFKEMLAQLHTDWVIIEGMNEVPLPKIITAQNQAEADQLMSDTVFAITGKFSEIVSEYQNIPCLNAQTQIEILGNLVLAKVFDVLPFTQNGFCGHCGYNCKELTALILQQQKTRQDCSMNSPQKIKILFNEEEILLNGWVEKVTQDLLLAFCQNLKGYQKGCKIEITLEDD